MAVRAAGLPLILTALAAASPTHLDPYGLVRGRCSYPCECTTGGSGGTLGDPGSVSNIHCAPGVSVIRDGCGCCPICAGQEGHPCDLVRLCDSSRMLECKYQQPSDPQGTCALRHGRGCLVSELGLTVADGESFKLDCRTQCSCQNGTYGCVSLCPHENVHPSPLCRNPQLVHIRGACCRDWLCESQLWNQGQNEPKCVRYSSPWSECSSRCGEGISTRLTNDNAACQMRNESRICLVRPCLADNHNNGTGDAGHRSVRRRHVCRATVKSVTPTHLRENSTSCRSVKAFRPKYCASCAGQCCKPKLATTLRVPFECPNSDPVKNNRVVLKEIMWIVKCVCNSGDTC